MQLEVSGQIINNLIRKMKVMPNSVDVYVLEALELTCYLHSIQVFL